MPQNGYAQIPVREETQKKLIQRKLKKQAKLGETVTWDDFLLDATKER